MTGMCVNRSTRFLPVKFKLFVLLCIRRSQQHTVPTEGKDELVHHFRTRNPPVLGLGFSVLHPARVFWEQVLKIG